MARKKDEQQNGTSFWFVAALIVAVTVGTMVWIGSDDGDKAAAPQTNQADEEVLEVQPLVPKGKIASASWREKNAAAGDTEDLGTGESMLDDNMDPFADPEKSSKAEESLKKTIDRIHGLGVYVAPAEDDDE